MASSFNKALTLPDSVPTTIISPTFNVPDFTNKVITEPFPLSTLDSTTTPLALMFGSLFNRGLFNVIEEILIKLKEKFEDNIYIEIQRHNDLNEK